MMVFIEANGFSIGFLNVSSSFPDVGEGARDIGFAFNMFLGHMFILVNMFGSILFYRWGRRAGWKGMQNYWPGILRFCTYWHLGLRCWLAASFAFVILGPAVYGYDVPLDLGDPEIPGPDEMAVYPEYSIHLPAVPAGLAFGIAMSILGCIVATVVSDVLFEEQKRIVARLVANFASTVAVLFLDQVQSRRKNPSFVLMKFSSSFCGALSAFTGTIGDVFDESFGVAYEESSYDDEEEVKRGKGTPLVTGSQNFIAHWFLTLMIMLFGVYVSSAPDTASILQPRVLSRKIDTWGTFAGMVSRSDAGSAAFLNPPIEY